MNRLAGALLITIASGELASGSPLPQTLTVQDILALPRPAPHERIHYGADPLQFGELRLPEGEGPHSVAIVIHGGCWRSRYDLAHISSFCAALTEIGVATWSLEYRRLGNPGGGWPGTFEDVAAGADHLKELAARYRLDVDRVAAVGHSAGGHLALWLAARPRFPNDSPFYAKEPLSLRGVVSLAGIPDLRAFGEGCEGAVRELLGGVPDASRYRYASPAEHLPLGVPQILIHGARDPIVPLELGRQYEEAATKMGDDVRLVTLEEAAHFEVIAPQSPAWRSVAEAVRTVLSRP